MTGKPTEREGADSEYSIDEEDQLQPEDTLLDRGVDDVLDEGYSPVERPLAVDEYGVTAAEQMEPEPLEQRLAREVPDVSDAPPATADENAEFDDEVGDARAGRLAEDDSASDLEARDVGIDGAGASAEEAAVHVTVAPNQ